MLFQLVILLVVNWFLPLVGCVLARYFKGEMGKPAVFCGTMPMLHVGRNMDDCAGEDFLHQLPHEYYDENMLHALLISEVKDYEECIRLTDTFLPFVDNWAVCDIMSPKVFAKHKKELLAKIKTWSKSSHVYTCRFGIEALMSHYLDKDFKSEYLQIPASAISGEYYVKMMVAWFFATALAKQWDATIPYIENKKLAPWTHNKTIQKAIESYRITPEQKAYLRSLKIK